MSRFILLLFISLLGLGLMEAQNTCTPAGDFCTRSSECCNGYICNPWAVRCTRNKMSTSISGKIDASAEPKLHKNLSR